MGRARCARASESERETGRAEGSQGGGSFGQNFRRARVRCPPDERHEGEGAGAVAGPEIVPPPLPTASKSPAIHGFLVRAHAHARVSNEERLKGNESAESAVVARATRKLLGDIDSFGFLQIK